MSECVGVWQLDMGNEGRGYAKTRKNRDDDCQMDARYKLSDKKSNAELLSRLDIESVSVVVRRGRLKWFGHVERKQPDDWVSACRHTVVEKAKGRGRGRPRKTWRECVEEDM